MTETAGGIRWLPVLGTILVAILIGSLGLSALQTGGGPAGPAGSAAALAEAQGAVRAASGAMRGDGKAQTALAAASRRLAAASDGGLDREAAGRLEQLRTAVATIDAGRGELTALRNAADRLDRLAQTAAQQVGRLQASPAVRGQPAIAAQLERLRILSDGVRRDVRALSLGVADVATTTQGLLDADQAIERIVRGLQEGDAELALRPLAGPDAVRLFDDLRATMAQSSKALRDVVANGDRLAALRQTWQQAEQLAAALPVTAGAEPAGGGVVPWVISGLLGLGVLLALAMLWIFRGLADTRRAAVAQAAQNDRNQQAIQTLLDEMGGLADGDLTVHATVTEDFTGAIADSINYAVEALRELVTTINEGALMVDAAARQTEGSARQLGAASEAQSKQIDSASRSISRMASSIEEVSGNAERSADVARHSVAVAHKGGDAVRRTIEGMNAIRETIQDTSKRIKRLGESSQEIGNIVELINDIADQTNILALNAAIQASMAGEAGRGFAVVADEVQRLAERSTNATKQIDMLVRTIQADTNEAIVSMERSTTDVVGGALLAENAGAALEEIEQVSNQIAALVQNISSSAREQTKAASAVNRSMDVLKEINTETAATTSATTSAISKLAELSTHLRRSVAGFRLPQVAVRSGAASGVVVGTPPAREEGAAASGRYPQPAAYATQRTA
jgi:twitching motility protein PilJ